LLGRDRWNSDRPVSTSVTGVSKQSTNALAHALKLDMTRWWNPTGATYFNHVSKGRILDVVTEAAGANAPTAEARHGSG